LKIAEAAEYQLPSLSPEMLEQYRKDNEKNIRLRGLVATCNAMLKNDAAKPTRDYLKARGITEEEIEQFQLGYFPSRYELKKELEEEGIEILDILPLLDRIDKSKEEHRLLIPWFSNGNVTNLKARSLLGDAQRKYLNWNEGGSGMFNLPGCRRSKHSRLLIVEGEIDCIAATTMLKGLDVDVVAAGRIAITEEQAEACKAAGYMNVTICFDADAGKDNRSHIQKAISVLESGGFSDIFILEMPVVEGQKVGPAALRMIPGGVELFVDAFNHAIAATDYILNGIKNSYKSQCLSSGELSPRLQKEMLRDITTAGSSMPAKENRELFKAAATKLLESFNIPTTAFQEVIEQEAEARRRKQTKEQLGKLNQGAAERIAAGDIQGAIRYAAEMQQLGNVSTFDNTTKAYSIRQWQNDLLKHSPLLKTGFPSLDAIVGFPSGNLSIVAGRPSHGKTTFMQGSILKAVEANPGKTFLYFNYEEPTQKIVAKFLNIQANQNFTTKGHDATRRTDLMPAEMERRGNVDYIEFLGRNQALFINDPELLAAAESLESYFAEQEGSPARLYVDCNTYSLEHLIDKIHAACSRCDVGGIYVDYIQKIRPGKAMEIRMAMVEASRALQTAAKDCGIPIIAGAQFNREAATAGSSRSKRPSLEMLKESGSLEEDANVVLGIYNYFRESETIKEAKLQKERNAQRNAQKAKAKGEAVELQPITEEDIPQEVGTGRAQYVDVIVLKNREGATNQTAKFLFDGITMNYRERNEQ
jgi:replicative DNA helicase